MMLIVEKMMRSRDNDVSVEKAVDRVVELGVNLMEGMLRSSLIHIEGR